MTTPVITREILLASGFEPTRYEGQEGEFLLKKLRVGDMPYAREHIVDGDNIYDTMMAYVEVIPGDQVQFFIEEAEYLDGPVPVSSEAGMSLLVDAGLQLPAAAS